MRRKSMLTVGFLSLVAAIAVVNASDSFAANAQRVDVIDSLHETVAQLDGMQAGDHRSQRVDVIDNIGSGGPTYSYTTKSQRVDVIDNIGYEGPKYSYNTKSQRVDVIDSIGSEGSK